ncbi:MAG: hypothetical protein M5U34_00075 [Chloroflexi bacterium]|nr:hypothetical protein [Chloroflexota bacterium]
MATRQQENGRITSPFDWIILAELFLALYAVAALLLAISQNSWGSTFFLATCALGFGYVAALSLWELWAYK